MDNKWKKLVLSFIYIFEKLKKQEYAIGHYSFFVRCASCISEPFCVSNGLRQGGILSPVFFSVFVDELSVWLRSVSVECCIGDTCMNHIIYVYDTVLLAPSPAALQKLLDIAAQFINDRELVANMKKNKCMTIKPSVIKCYMYLRFILMERPLKQQVKRAT